MVRGGRQNNQNKCFIYVFVCLFNFSWPGCSKAGTTFSLSSFVPNVRGTWLGLVTDSRALRGSLQRRNPIHPEAPRWVFECHRKGAGGVGLGVSRTAVSSAETRLRGLRAEGLNGTAQGCMESCGCCRTCLHTLRMESPYSLRHTVSGSEKTACCHPGSGQHADLGKVSLSPSNPFFQQHAGFSDLGDRSVSIHP